MLVVRSVSGVSSCRVGNPAKEADSSLWSFLCRLPEFTMTPFGGWEPGYRGGVFRENPALGYRAVNSGLDVAKGIGIGTNGCSQAIVVDVHIIGFLSAGFEYECGEGNGPLAEGVRDGSAGKCVAVSIELAVPAALEVRFRDVAPSEADDPDGIEEQNHSEEKGSA